MAKDDKPNAGFVGRVVGDPANPPQTRLLTGWLGAAVDEGFKRLYTDAELSSYVDIPEDAILYTEPIRDVQPAGGVFVWIQRDAPVKQGGSAASRAGRFLQGQVAQDYSSPEKAGLRCVTQVPCGEVTGFTGKCTNEPVVGGAWPCLTALPLCSAEPTGFTGQCTEQPWPNPTRYLGCTILHCPTNDLTHQPHICNIVASGMPGCGGFVPPKAGEPQQRAGAEAASGEAAAAAQPPTNIPGCGYTKTWGLCETHLLGCGWTKQGVFCNDTQAPKCQPSVQIPCITQDPACNVTRNQLCGTLQRNAAAVPPATQICATAIGCDITTAGCGTQVLQCNPSAVDACPSAKGCTHFGCETAPPTQFCTHVPEGCPTWCGPQCQSQAPCTHVNCTHAGPQCPEHTVGIACTALFPQCHAPDLTVATLAARGAGGAMAQAAPGSWPTPQTRCFVCDPVAAQVPQQTVATVCTQFNCGGVAARAGQGRGSAGATAFGECTHIGFDCPLFHTHFEAPCGPFNILASSLEPQCFPVPWTLECRRSVLPHHCPVPTGTGINCTIAVGQCGDVPPVAVATVPGNCVTLNCPTQRFACTIALGQCGDVPPLAIAATQNCVKPTPFCQLREDTFFPCTRIGPGCFFHLSTAFPCKRME